MRTITVLGADGRTGKAIVRQLIARGDQVVGMLRNPERRGEVGELGASPLLMDLSTASVAELAAAFRDTDAIVFAAGANGSGDDVTEIDRDGSIKAVDAAEQAGVSRFVQVSALGAHRAQRPEGYDGDDWRPYWDAKQAADDHLRDSHLDWTILEPSELSDRSADGHVELADEGMQFGSISREDVAATIVASLDDDRTIGHMWELSGGDQTIDEALEGVVNEFD
jgi:uncharacterized protein YbjT (DUF2867 family)